MSTYYKKAAVYPLIFSSVTGVILIITHDGSNYKSEWFTDDGFVETVLMTIALSVIIAAISFTIFLNNVPAIKANSFYSFLSWMIPASLVCSYVIYLELQNFFTRDDYEGNRLLDGYIMSIAIVHLVSLVITHVLFRRELSTQHGG